jgi:hypothetical protein
MLHQTQSRMRQLLSAYFSWLKHRFARSQPHGHAATMRQLRPILVAELQRRKSGTQRLPCCQLRAMLLYQPKPCCMAGMLQGQMQMPAAHIHNAACTHIARLRTCSMSDFVRGVRRGPVEEGTIPYAHGCRCCSKHTCRTACERRTH